jgi:excisionase family DNA binding protein
VAAIELPDSTLDAIAQRAAALVKQEMERAGLKREEPYMDVERTAEYLGGCKPQRIYDLVYAGEIPHGRAGRRLVFRRSELDEWVRNGGGR